MVIVTLARWEQSQQKNGNPVVSDGNSLLLVADNPQKIIGLSNQSGTGHLITGPTQFCWK